MSSYGYVGFGTYFDARNVSDENLTKFMKEYDPETLRDYEKERKEFGASCADLSNWLDYDYPIEGYVAGVISEKEGISLSYTFDGGVYLPYQMPWGLNDKEKNLSEADFETMMVKYLKVLDPGKICVFEHIVDELSLM